MHSYLSWGRVLRYEQKARIPQWRHEIQADLFAGPAPVLAYGRGRSYGDACLNDNGTLIDMSQLHRFIAFDRTNGRLTCEAGVSLAEIIDVVLPTGWFLPVTPGTKWVTLGGAVANDVHGKNHHVMGSFGRHVRRFELRRSDGSVTLCSPTENPELFAATIGGLGLTGLITWAEIQLIPVTSPMIDMESIRFKNLDAFFTLEASSNADYDYTVAWVDGMASGRDLGRGIFMRGNHSTTSDGLSPVQWQTKNAPIAIPIEAPHFVLNDWSLRTFNKLYYNKQRRDVERTITHFEPFFYPLDVVGDWNKMYGRRGFFQYQFVVPEGREDAIPKVLETAAASGIGSSLSVLKRFGDKPSPGLMSFPMPGLTLTLDFPNLGERVLSLMQQLNGIVEEAGGRLYPAKDAVMNESMFKKAFPAWSKFQDFVDPRFSSSFWRRVNP